MRPQLLLQLLLGSGRCQQLLMLQIIANRSAGFGDIMIPVESTGRKRRWGSVYRSNRHRRRSMQGGRTLVLGHLMASLIKILIVSKLTRSVASTQLSEGEPPSCYPRSCFASSDGMSVHLLCMEIDAMAWRDILLVLDIKSLHVSAHTFFCRLAPLLAFAHLPGPCLLTVA